VILKLKRFSTTISIEEIILILTVKELGDGKKNKRRGSTIRGIYIIQNRALDGTKVGVHQFIEITTNNYHI
jgi:hypothetical protein